MAICTWCNLDMSHEDTCIGNIAVDFPDGTTLPSVRYMPDYGGPDQRCHDCNVAYEGNHHPGCDMERCPACGGQLISCGCLDDEDSDTPVRGNLSHVLRWYSELLRLRERRVDYRLTSTERAEAEAALAAHIANAPAGHP